MSVHAICVLSDRPSTSVASFQEGEGAKMPLSTVRQSSSPFFCFFLVSLTSTVISAQKKWHTLLMTKKKDPKSLPSIQMDRLLTSCMGLFFVGCTYFAKLIFICPAAEGVSHGEPVTLLPGPQTPLSQPAHRWLCSASSAKYHPL